MHRLFKYLRPIIHLAVHRAGLVLLAALLLSALAFYHALSLDIETDFSELVPEDYPSVQALQKMRTTVGGEGSDVAVAILSPSFEANKAFAEDLIPKALEMEGEGQNEPYLESVEYKRDTEFLENNAAYFATDEELERLKHLLEDEIERARLEANPFYVDFEEDFEDEELEDDDFDEFEEMYEWLVGNEYPVHPDETSMTLRFFPGGSQTNPDYIDQLYEDLEGLINSMNKEEYHEEMETVLAGRMMHRSLQIQSIREDVTKTFGIGAGAVMLLVIVYFFYKTIYARSAGRLSSKFIIIETLRLPVLALMIAIPLLMSLTWTFGTAAYFIGNLNMMTSTLALLLFGLGVDFGIHFYGRYSEERASGKNVPDSAEITFLSTGQAITVGALTTSVALLVLNLADFRGFSEFGFIAGIGILFAVVAMIIIFPAVISLVEKLKLLNLETDNSDPKHILKHDESANKKSNRSRFYTPRTILVFTFVSLVIAAVTIPNSSFEYDFDKLEPSYPEFEAKKEIVDGYASGRRGSNPAYIVAENQEEAVKIAGAVREMKRQDTTITSIENVKTLQDRFPLQDEKIYERLEKIEVIRELTESQYLQDVESVNFERLKKGAQTTSPVSVDQIPGYLKDMFTTQDGEVGTFVMIFPSVELSDGRQSIQFANDVGKIELDDGTTHYAGSTSIIAAEMLMLVQEESPLMIALVLIMIVIILGFSFQAVKWTVLALIPLLLGFLWMLSTTVFLDLNLNFFNLVVLPAMLGIGVDDGVHIVHRYRESGKGSIMKVLRSTGEHCTIGTMTTMIGFLGLLFSYHPGLRSIGQIALIGLVTILIAMLVVLPAIIQFLEDRELIKH